MSQQSELLKERTMTFSVSVLRLIDRLPHTPGGLVVARQLAGSATSVGANYRSACSARSRREFISKLCIVVEESEESVYWLDVIDRARMFDESTITPVRQEAAELLAIFAKSLCTARANSRTSPVAQ
jgi:four helix bundle protein